MYNPTIPYNDLPLLHAQLPLETTAVLKKLVTASRALAEFNGALLTLPNPHLFIDTIQLQEARASSEIENIVTTNDDLFRSVVADSKASYLNAKEVLHYKEALWLGLNALEERPVITTNLLVRMVQCVKGNTAGIRNAPGTQLTNPTSGKVVYTPPAGEEHIRGLLHNLETFMHSQDGLDPLVKLAAIHYQFEAIHPFMDGNGRVGRILLLLYLKLTGLVTHPSLFFSVYILEHRSAYYELLRGVTEREAWEPWVLFILDMVEKTAENNLMRINDIQRCMSEFSAELKSKLPKVYSRELVEALFHLPYIKRKYLVDAGFGTYKTVGNYLLRMEEEGLLKSELVGKERLFLNLAFYQSIQS